MNLSIVLALSLLAAVLAVALLRERRLRLALETLVSKLFNLWRNSHADDNQNKSAVQSSDAGLDNDRRQRQYRGRSRTYKFVAAGIGQRLPSCTPA